MVWPPRYGTTAAAGGSAQQPPDRPANAEAFLSRSTAPRANPQYPIAEVSPQWAESASYVWLTEPTLQQITDGWFEYPPETIGLSRPVLSLVQVSWPPAAKLNDTLGLFIYSRPIGSVNWRTNPTYIPFTQELESYKGFPSYFRSSVNVVNTDEYQARIRYDWLPPGSSFDTPVLSGESANPILVIRCGERLTRKTYVRDMSYRVRYDYALGIIDLFVSASDRAFTGSQTAELKPGEYTIFRFDETLPESSAEGAGANGSTAALSLKMYAYLMFTA